MQDIALIDHHCHGVVTAELTRRSFEALMSESYQPPPGGTNHFQKPLGLAIRRHCAPLLDLEPLASADAYLERRQELGAAEVNRRLLRAATVGIHLLDTGHRAADITDVAMFAGISGHRARDVVRIEAVAEAVVTEVSDARDFPTRLAEELMARGENAVGFKSIVAYRTTFKIDQTAPSLDAVRQAAGEWIKTSAGRRPRLVDPVIVRYGLWTAADICRQRKLPLQLHVGFGDPDVYMHACDPTHFTDSCAAWRPGR